MAKKAITVNEQTARELIELIKGHNIAELSVSQGDTHITVKQRPGKAKVIMPISHAAPQTAPAEEEQVVPEQKKSDERTTASTVIKSEFVGIFSTTNKGKSLASVGATIEKGKPLGYVTAMKIQHEIKAAGSCKVLKVLVKDNSIVEYGTPLFEVETH